MTTVNVTLNNGKVIRFETDEATAESGTSYDVDGAGVLTIASREQSTSGEFVITHQRFSPSAWYQVEEVETLAPCSPPPWTQGVVGSSAVGR